MTDRGIRRRWPGLSIGLLALSLVLAACGPVATLTPEQEQGQVLYETFCASCHGLKGEGQPNWKIPDERGVYPAPPHNDDGHTWHHADEQLMEMIADGTGMPNSTMSPFRETLTREQMQAILAYIKTFWGDDERAFQTEVNKAWHEQNR